MSQELVQNDITIRRLEEEIKALNLTLSTSGNLDPVTSLRHETDSLRAHLDNINRDIAVCNKQLQERQMSIKEAERTLQSLKRSQQEQEATYAKNLQELHALGNDFMRDIAAFKAEACDTIQQIK